MNETCIVGTYAGRVLAVNVQTGSLRWEGRTRGKIVSNPCIAAGNVIIGSYDKSVHAFDQGTGEKRWTFRTRGVVRASPELMGDERIVIGSGKSWNVNPVEWSTPFCALETHFATKPVAR